MMTRSRLIFLASSCILVVLLVAGSVWGEGEASKERAYSELKTFTQSLRLVRRHYVDDVNLERVMRGAYRGLVERLDPWSSWLGPEGLELVETRGDQEGVGIGLVKASNGFVRVASVRWQSPAWEAGVRPGRWIEKIDGHATKEMTLMEAQALLRGPDGSKVKIAFFEGDDEEGSQRSIELERRELQGHLALQEVPGHPETAHLRLLDLDEGAADAFARALEELQEEGRERLVLDLRTVFGGSEQELLAVADLLLDDVEVASIHARGDESVRTLAATEGKAFEGPIAVLVGPGTVGEGEALALALGANDRASLVGRHTLGKSYRQRMINFEDGTAVYLSVEEYRGPGGLEFKGNGVVPDLEVAAAGDEDEGEGDRDLATALESFDAEAEQQAAPRPAA